MKKLNPVYVKVIYALIAITTLVMASGAGESWPMP